MTFFYYYCINKQKKTTMTNIELVTKVVDNNFFDLPKHVREMYEPDIDGNIFYTIDGLIDDILNTCDDENIKITTTNVSDVFWEIAHD